MAKVKTTKGELKVQRDALRRYERFLPTLRLKKQQLELELRQVEHRLEQSTSREQALLAEMESWIALFADQPDWTANLAVTRVVTEEINIAGVNLPALREVELRQVQPSLYLTPPWFDDALAALAELIRRRVERRILAIQKDLLGAELRTTSQRVNLFERVKIPESREAIRRIRIVLGDLQTLDVARSKIAKQKALERETGA